MVALHRLARHQIKRYFCRDGARDYLAEIELRVKVSCFINSAPPFDYSSHIISRHEQICRRVALELPVERLAFIVLIRVISVLSNGSTGFLGTFGLTPSQALFGMLLHCLDQLCMTCKVDRILFVVTAATGSRWRQSTGNRSSDCLCNSPRRFVLRKVAHAF